MPDFHRIRLLILDVDGVLTDGRLAFTAEGGPGVGFHAHDGAAIKTWRRCGLTAAILSGRRNEAVTRRAAELGIEIVNMGLSRKLEGYEAICRSMGAGDDEVAYVGDDAPDLEAMGRAGFAVATGDASPDVKRAAAYVTRRRGGCGAVAEAIEYVLRKQDRWTRALRVEA